MKTSFFSLVFLAFSLAFSSRAAAQTNEAMELYNAVMEQKAEVNLMANQPPSYDGLDEELAAQCNQMLKQVRNMSARIEKTKGKMTASQLAAFKAEAAKLEEQRKALAKAYWDKVPEVQKCVMGCDANYPNWWQGLQYMICWIKCAVG